VIWIFFILLFLIFPLFLNIKVSYLNEYKKLFISLRLFNFIKIIGGYFTFEKDATFFHVSTDKAYIFKYKLPKFDKKFKYLKDYKLYSCNLIWELGKYDPFLPFMVGHFINTIFNIYTSVRINKRKKINLTNNVIIFENENKLNLSLSATIQFNILTIIITLIKLFLEKTIWKKT